MYAQTHIDFESVFGTMEWTDRNIETIPMNYQGKTEGAEYIRIGVFPATGELEFGNTIITGFAEANIFVTAGIGERRAFEIADALDAHLQRMTIGETQFFKSIITKVGVDATNASLWRLDYQIPFRTTI